MRIKDLETPVTEASAPQDQEVPARKILTLKPEFVARLQAVQNQIDLGDTIRMTGRSDEEIMKILIGFNANATS